MTTPRLLLRPHRIEDLAARTAIFADDAFLCHVGGSQTREESWARIQRYLGHWALLGYGLWAVEERASGRLLGEVGLARFERGLGNDFDAAPEGAWIVAPGQERGYATEAMQAAINWYETRFGPSRMVCVVARENLASQRVATKLGFVPHGEREYKGAPRLVLMRQAGAKPVASASGLS